MAKNVETKGKKVIKGRIFNVSQDVIHKNTGEKLLSREQVENGLQNKGIAEYAYILHDKDVYGPEDEEKNPENKAGTLKNPHWHICLRTTYYADVDTIAGYFGIPAQYVDVPKGRDPGKWAQIVKYLTHEDDRQQMLGKYLYPDAEIIANFDFRALLDNYKKYGHPLSQGEQMRLDVLKNGKTLKECDAENTMVYIANMRILRDLRLQYISRMPAPDMRINFYLCGSGGIGKGLLSRAIARSLCPHLTDDDDIFFVVGSGKALLEGYDGQPVIIWPDRRAITLLQDLGGRENVFNVFDTFPPKVAGRQNIKYGSVSLINRFNIVDSVQDYKEFFDGLAGGYTDAAGNEHIAEDRSQPCRRFPMVIPIFEDFYEILLNKGFLDNDRNFEEFELYSRVRGNMRKALEACGNTHPEVARNLEKQMISPVAERAEELLQRQRGSDLTDDEILKKFADFGASMDIGEPVLVDADGATEDKDLPWERVYDEKAAKAEQMSFAFGDKVLGNE